MNETTQLHLKNIFSKDKELQNAAYTFLMAATEVPVQWAYEGWDDLLAGLGDKDNRVRAITAQVFSNLAKSVTKDERFVTARHCLQSLWKVGMAGKEQQSMVVEGLASRFNECIREKQGTLIRYDIIQGLSRICMMKSRMKLCGIEHWP